MPYNIGVARPGSGSSSGSTPGTTRGKTGKAPAPHQWFENIGVIVIVILILAITLTRYWHNIHWSTR